MVCFVDMTDKRDSRVIRTQQSRSGTVSYGDPVVLKDNSKTRVVFVPFFIPRSDHQELAGKITTYAKSSDGLVLREEKSVSFSGEETRRLLKSLNSHLAVAEEGTSGGEYIAIAVGSDTRENQFGEHDSKTIAHALTTALNQRDIAEHLKDTELSAELSNAFRGAIRIREISTAIEQLRHMLNNGVVLESNYQQWCDDHYWAFGPAKRLRDQNRSISISDKVDKLLPDIASGLSDVIELKRPDKAVLKYDKDHRNYYFSSETSQAIGQCHRYLDVLHDVAAEGLQDHPEIVAYHPRATIVIGRSADWNEEKTKALHGLNQRLRSIKIMTYDHLLAQSEAILSVLSPPSPITEPAARDSATAWNDFDEEPPF